MESNLSIVKDQFKELPNNIEAEQAVIGSLLVNNEIFDEISTIISGINFYDPMHQKIFDAVDTLIYKGMLANPITLKNYFEDEKYDLNVPEYLVKITKFSTSVRQALEYSKIIYDMFVRRELVKISEQTMDSAKLSELDTTGQNIIENTEKSLFDLAEKGSFNSNLVKFDAAMKQTIEMASAAYKNEEGIVGVPTGLRDLDDKLGGLHQSDLIIIAGRPSMGKTAFMMNIAESAVISGSKPVVVFSLEMPSNSLIMRMLSSLGRIDQSKIRSGQLGDDDWPRLTSAVTLLNDKQLFVDDTPGLTPNEMRSRSRRIVREHGQIGMIVVDYLQLMQTSGTPENRATEISEISRSLKSIAKEFDCPVIAGSQLNRSLEQRTDKRPIMSDLRESGAIEQDADLIMAVYRDEVYHEDTPDRGVAEIIILKQRNGPIGRKKLAFIGQYTKFEDLARDYDDYYE